MATFLITFLVFCAAIAAMTVGLVFNGREIKGSCGGINNIDGDSCSVCGRPAGEACDEPGSLRDRLNGDDKPADKQRRSAKSAF